MITLLHNNAYGLPQVDPSVYLRAYPDHIASVKDNELIWQDGTKMPIKTSADPKSLEKALNDPDLYMQLYIPYPQGPLKNPPSPDSDPGRIRYVPFFQKMYGSTKEEVLKNLTEIPWMPRTFQGKEASSLPVTKVNHVSEIMQALSNDLDDLVQKKPEYKKYLANPAGTFSWRLIAGTNRPSAHSFGMTIDINTKYSNYWLWDYKKAHNLSIDAPVNETELKPEDVPPYKNQIPWDIVELFEKHHFIWGGKFFHYDTMHFEYRPELFIK